MAGPTSIIAALLLLALCVHHFIPTGSVGIPSSCCLSFISKKIPQSRVVSYQLSSGSICPKAGVIFTTKKGQKVCSDPKHLWVQRYMRNLDAKQKQPSPGPRARGKVPRQRRRGNSTVD